MKGFWKCFAALALCACCLIGGVACGGTPEIPEQPIDVDLDPNIEADIVVLVDVDNFGKTLVESLAEGFRTHYSNVTVRVVQTSDAISYIRSGDQVDLLHVIGENVSFYASQNLLENLDPYMEAQNFDASLYYPSMIDLGKDIVSGNQYMMPRDYSRIVCYYNRDLFDALKVDYPVDTEENPWTWEAFVQKCKDLKTAMAADSRYTNYVPVQASMSYDILNWGIVRSYGVEGLLKEDFTLIDTGTPEYRSWQAGMETASLMIENGYSLNSNRYSATDFQTGTAAMALTVAPNAAAFDQGQINYDIISFPAIGEDPKAPSGTSGYAIAQNSANKNVAWAFLNYMMSEEGQNIMTDGTGLVPVLTSLAEDEDAAWRTMTNGAGNPVNADALLSYSERDVISDWFGDLPSLAQNAYKGFYNTFLKNVCDGNRSFAQAYTILSDNIEEYQSMYPEYFN